MEISQGKAAQTALPVRQDRPEAYEAFVRCIVG